MSNKKRNEVSYYPEIMDYIEAQLKSNFRANCNRDLQVYWKIGELKSRLNEILEEHPELDSCLGSFARKVPPLSLDIFAVITDGEHFELLILEIKLVKAVGLSEWSQLVGYCIVSDARFGLLINIDAGASPRLNNLLQTDISVSKIIRKKESEDVVHELGFMSWDSLTNNFEYSNIGEIWSLSELSDRIVQRFTIEE